MKVAVLNDYQRAVPTLVAFSRASSKHAIEVFDDAESDEAKLAARLADFDAIVLLRERTRITSSLLAKLPRLKVLVQTGGIGAHVDVAACRSRGVTVCAGGGSPTAPAELTWAMILAAMRHLVPEAERMRKGEWQGYLGRTLAGRRLGLVGFGKIAQLVARYAAAFDMRVSVWGRESTLVKARDAGLTGIASMTSLFTESDVVSLHLRLNDDTRSLVKSEHLAAMRPDALIVNTSRAELIAPGALERALQAGRPGYAAIDVYEREPVLEPGHPLTTAPNVLALPHIGFVEKDTYEQYFGDAFEAIDAFVAGKPVRVVQ